MIMTQRNQFFFVALVLSVASAILASGAPCRGETLHFTTQRRAQDDAGHWQIERKEIDWKPEETAVVICDMWDTHTCKNAALRVAEMAPQMNEVVHELRERGCFIIHCPSNTMDFYKDHPARKRAQGAKLVETKVPLKNWCHLDKAHEGDLPIDDSDGGCDTPADEQAKWAAAWKAKAGDKKWPWTRQIETIDIDGDRDAITDSAEAYYMMHARGIKNVIVMGVHTNMCVLGRPFSIRQMVYQGQNVLLMRDMTDAMYNPAKRPQVSHFRGTELVIEHIEKHWCPTITSADVLSDKQPFVFSKDERPHVVMMIGEREYETHRTLPAFAVAELPHCRTTYVFPRADDRNDFPGLEVLASADLLVVSVRRRTLPVEQLAMVQKYVASGKPVVALRTASHAFALRNEKPPEGHAVWPEFDREVLGGNYHNHHGNKLTTQVNVEPGAKDHLILAGVSAEKFTSASSLYMNHPISDATTVLMTGRIDGVEQAEPVAWTHVRDGQRVFYTSLGGPGDFQQESFRKMLANAIAWALK